MEQETKHTPGPWQVIRDEEEGLHHVIKMDRAPGTAYIAREIYQGKDDGEADARLIASAPDLLEALKGLTKSYASLCNQHFTNFTMPVVFNNAMAAIKKATDDHNYHPTKS